MGNEVSQLSGVLGAFYKANAGGEFRTSSETRMTGAHLSGFQNPAGAVGVSKSSESGVYALTDRQIAVLDGIGAERIRHGSIAGKCARGLCGKQAVEAYLSLKNDPESALSVLYSAFEKSCVPEYGDHAHSVREQFEKVFTIPEKVTQSNIEAFMEKLQENRSDMSFEEIIVDGKFSPQISAAHARELLGIMQQRRAGESVDEGAMSDLGRVFDIIYTAQVQTLTDHVRGAELQLEKLDANSPTYQQERAFTEGLIVNSKAEIDSLHARIEGAIDCAING